MACRHYLNQCWYITNLTLRSKLLIEILIEILTFSFTKMHLKMSPGKWRPFCLGLNLLRRSTCRNIQCISYHMTKWWTEHECSTTHITSSVSIRINYDRYWRHGLEILFVLLALCEGIHRYRDAGNLRRHEANVTSLCFPHAIQVN